LIYGEADWGCVVEKLRGTAKVDTHSTQTQLAGNLRLSPPEKTRISGLAFWQRNELIRLATNVARTKSFAAEVRLTEFIRSNQADVAPVNWLDVIMEVFRLASEDDIANRKFHLDRLARTRRISEFLRRELQRLSEQSAKLAEHAGENHEDVDPKQTIRIRNRR